MITPLYRTMALWVLSAAVLISAAMAGAGYYYEMAQIDAAIVELAAGEARTFAAMHPGVLTRELDGGAEQKLGRFLETREANAEGHFIIAELYDSERNSLGEAASPSWSAVEAALSIK
ncbi:MAG: hypothetical protein WCJ64_26315, partial [Rhodospirillaceae bacterium]